MFVLSRRSNESIVVTAEDGFHRAFKIKVISVHGGDVKLGIEVQPHCHVYPAESSPAELFCDDVPDLVCAQALCS